MKDTKLLRYYRTFSVEEAKEWLTFVQSPYFNTNPNVVSLAKILRSYYPNFDHKGLAKEKVYRRIYGKEDYQDIKMRKLMSAGVKLVERYWVVSGIENDPIQSKFALRNQYRHRELIRDYEKLSYQLIDLMEADPELTDHGIIGAIHLDLYDDQQLIGSKNYIKHMTASSEHSYIAECTNQILNSIIWSEQEYTYNNSPSTFWLQISNHHNADILSRSVEYTLLFDLKILLDYKEKLSPMKLMSFWNRFTSQSSDLTSKVRFVITAIILNLVRDTLRSNSGVQNIRIKIIDWAVTHKGLIYRGNISGSRLHTICTELCRDQNTTLATKLLESHKSFLPRKYQEEFYKLCLAVILRQQNKFEESYYLLNSFDLIGFPLYEVRRRSILLLVALDYSITRPSIGNTIKNLVDRDNKYFRADKTLSKNTLIYQINFNNLIFRLSNYIHQITGNTQIANKIMKDVNANLLIASSTKQWFKEKLNN